MPLVSVGSSGMHRDLGDGLLQPRRTLHTDLAVPQLEVAGACFQHMARDAEQLFPDDPSGADKRTRDHYRIAAAPGAGAGETVVGVGIGDADVGEINL